MKYFISVFLVVCAVLLIVDPSGVSAAVGAASENCLEVVIPSLFAFTVLSVYLQKSGLYRVALRPLTVPLSKLLRLDEELCAVILLANVGGYPVGVKLLSELVHEGRLSRENAGRMLCCCFGSGPAFVVGIAGLRVFGSAAAGLALFGICFGTSLLMAAFVRSRGEIALEKGSGQLDLSADCFVGSVLGAARVMFTVCAMIVGFAAVSALLGTLGVYGAAGALLPDEAVFSALLEVTRIKELSAARYALPLCAALLSFGGVCVLMQVTALSGEIPLRRFVISRAAAAAVSAILALPFSRSFIAEDAAVFAPNVKAVPFSGNAALSICVLAMCGILLVGELAAKKR